MKKIILDTSSFQEKGGWKLDTQFVTTMGVPYLLAHGLGEPVNDAQAIFESNEAGDYHMFVYTYNWVSPWTEKYSPGIFNISINESIINKNFGSEGNRWNWEYGGTVSLVKGQNKLVLKDITGFEGRCGLICFSDNKDIVLPTEPQDFIPFVFDNISEDNIEEERYDFVICGGGIAGICGALASSRNGVKTLIIQDRPVVGGNNSSEVRVWLGGETNFEPYPSIGNIVNELEQVKVGHYGSDNKGENYEDDKKLSLLAKEKDLTVLLNHIFIKSYVKDNKIDSILVWDIENRCLKRFAAKIFCDSTGDASLGDSANADYEITTNGHMGMTNPWYVEKTDEEKNFSKCPWAVNLYEVDFPGRRGVKDVYGHELDYSLGCWFWESGCELDPIDKAEYSRDLNFRAMYGAWDAIKNKDKDYKNYELKYSSFIGGKRESRRLFGDIILTKNEVSKGIKYEDGVVPSTWNFDVHYPDRRFYAAFHEGDSFLTKDYHEAFNKPFFIPYRCLYSRNIDNLFMAGRNVSVSHDALGTVRVMRTGGMMGEVVGYAAKMCVEKNVLPRDIYQKYLLEFTTELENIPNIKLNPLVANINAEGQ